MKNERGQSLVELAVSLVILLYLLSGAAEFGLLFFQYIQLRDAAQEGALYGSVHPTDPSKIIERARASSGSPLNLQNTGIVTVEIYIDDDPTTTADDIPYTNANYFTKDCEGHGLKVVVSYDHHVFMPFMSNFMGTIPLHGTVTDTILTPPPPCT
jgi:Flp pilus assembly protein TadG